MENKFVKTKNFKNFVSLASKLKNLPDNIPRLGVNIMQVQAIQNNNYNTSFGAKSTIINKVSNSLKSIGKQTVSNAKDEFVSLRQRIYLK